MPTPPRPGGVAWATIVSLSLTGTTLLIQALTPGIIQAGYSVEQQREVFEFVASSDYFSGPTWMAMCKAAMDAAHGIEYSTVVTTMARNGVEFGLRVSGLPGQWFTRNRYR